MDESQDTPAAIVSTLPDILKGFKPEALNAQRQILSLATPFIDEIAASLARVNLGLNGKVLAGLFNDKVSEEWQEELQAEQFSAAGGCTEVEMLRQRGIALERQFICAVSRAQHTHRHPLAQKSPDACKAELIEYYLDTLGMSDAEAEGMATGMEKHVNKIMNAFNRIKNMDILPSANVISTSGVIETDGAHAR